MALNSFKKVRQFEEKKAYKLNLETNNFTSTNSGRHWHGINVCPNESIFAHLCCFCPYPLDGAVPEVLL